MALRSRSRRAAASSGPGRGPTSDGRVRHGGPAGPGRRGARGRHSYRPPDRTASAVLLRRRAETLFGERDAWARGVEGGDGGAVGGGGTGDGRLAGGALSGALAAGASADGPSAGGPSAGGPSAGVVDAAGGRPGPGPVPRRVPRWAVAAATHPTAGTAGGNAGAPDPVARGLDPVARELDPVVGHPDPLAAPDGEADEEADVPRRGERFGLALRERMPLWVRTRCGL